MNIKKRLLNVAVISSLTGALATPVQAEILTFDFDGLFTIVTPSGLPVQNTSYPYYGDTTWGYGKRTQITGSMSLDTATGAGYGTIAPFEFFASGPAVAHDITLQAVGDGAGGPGSLVIGNLIFDWNGGSNINIEIVLDAAGLFGCIQSGMAPSETCSGVGALGGTDGMKWNLPMGPLPVATSTLDTDGVNITGDDGIGGSPMDNGPFTGFNANFDMLSVTMTGGLDCPVIGGCLGEVPVPAAVWLFGSGFIGLMGVARRRRDNIA